MFPNVRQKNEAVVLGTMRKEDKRGFGVIVMFYFFSLNTYY